MQLLRIVEVKLIEKSKAGKYFPALLDNRDQMLQGLRRNQFIFSNNNGS